MGTKICNTKKNQFDCLLSINVICADLLTFEQMENNKRKQSIFFFTEKWFIFHLNINFGCKTLNEKYT